MLAKSKTFLSPNVHYIVCEMKHEICESQILKFERTEIWKAIERSIKNIELTTRGDYIQAIKFVLPYAKAIDIEFKSKGALWDRDDVLYLWLSKYNSFPTSMMFCESRPSIMLKTLKFVAALERALGDVCVSRGRPCPFLLRDLILVDELWQIWGHTKMILLQILIGNPNGVNLRNLAWHGFLAPEEIPMIFLALLVFVCQDMASAIKELTVHLRPTIVDLPQIKLMNEFWRSEFSVMPSKVFSSCSDFVGSRMTLMLPYIEEAFRLYDSKKYGDCVVLSLPCLENFMRVLFALVNKCEDRILTAESSKLYTTMDEIMPESLKDGTKNRFPLTVGEDIMAFLMDVFMLQDGLRLRDRLSHGEMALEIISHEIAAGVSGVMLTIYALCHQEGDSSESICCFCGRTDLKSVELADMRGSSGTEMENCCNLRNFLARFRVRVKGYVMLFHPINISKRRLRNTWENVQHFTNIPTPESVQASSALIESPVITRQLSVHGKLLRLGGGEAEIVGLLRNITKEFETSSRNIISFLRDRWRLYNERALRSRQRVNYDKMVERLPEMCTLFFAILTEISNHFSIIDPTKVHDQPLPAVNKNLKRLLKVAENLRTATSQNKWDDACLLMSTLLKYQ